MNYIEREAKEKELVALHYAQNDPNPTKQLIARAAYGVILSERWAVFLALAKAAGYKKITIGSCTHWKNARANMVFAEPRKRKDNWPAIWSIADEAFYGHGCGNGLARADQVRVNFPLTQFVGEHVL